MAKKKRSVIRLLFQLALLGVSLFVLAFLTLFAYQQWQEHHLPLPSETDAPIIVLGAQVKEDGTPSVQLEWRLEKALEEYLRLPRAMVVCGAQGDNEPQTEASVMRAWLLDRGVAESHVLLDDTSMNTRENIRNAARMLGGNVQEAVIVTSDYHMPRALQIARDAGLRPYAAASPTKPEFWLKNHVRETLAWGKYVLNRLLPIGIF